MPKRVRHDVGTETRASPLVRYADLGDHFGRVFDIRFLDRDGERKWAFNTSFGLSHRAVDATVMVHGDDAGLKLPPVVAPVQVIVIPIWRTDGDLATVKEAVERMTERLAPVARLRVDLRDDRTPGYNYHATQSRFIGPAPLFV